MATCYFKGLLIACVLAYLARGDAARAVGTGNGGERLAIKDRREVGLTPQAAADRIVALPGLQNELRNHFGGYITVDEEHGRRLYYYFVESERDPANDPVVLWLNGGPGCSSFDGFVYEHGPFLFSLEHTPGVRGEHVGLKPNPYGWNQVANMIFLDSPAGVGLSYSETAADYVVEDARTAADADRFLRGWFQRFPQFANNRFFVSGESYAGIYVPNLVRQVLEGNEAGLQPAINIVGYLVGNGCTDQVYDGNAHPLYGATKSLLPWKGFLQLQEACGGSYWNITQGSECDKLWFKLSENLNALNIYDTLEYCFHGGPTPSATDDDDSSAGPASASRNLDTRAARHNAKVLRATAAAAAADAATGAGAAASGARAAAAASLTERLRTAGLLGQWPLPGGFVKPGLVLNWAHVAARLGGGDTTPPCTDSRAPCQSPGLSSPRLSHTPPCTDSRAADLWLNDPVVRDAIHAAPRELIGPWTLCSDKISYYRTHGSMIPIHINNTKGHGLRALIYSGDHDMAVPHTGSEAWTSELGFPVKEPWQPWFVADDQVAGFVVEYAHGLSYATVKGAGHMVPETNPREALAMFQRFIDHEPLASAPA